MWNFEEKEKHNIPFSMLLFGVRNGVAPIIWLGSKTFGVARVFGKRGVVPEKSDSPTNGVFSPPLRGVWTCCKAKIFCAS